ncbi:MAG: hypothetical protein AAGM38_02885 [Pseudomonadota bacterium]
MPLPSSRRRAGVLFAAPAFLAAGLLSAPSAQADEGGRIGVDVSCCSTPTVEAFPGDDVDGRRIRNYVFIYADRNNDGVLRGRELRIAKKRAIREDRSGRDYR